ncbi:LytR C-terminal domain-containing protein [Pseudoduganella sp. S-14]|uniref:LytR C-terminal domain-containing protein n=1 Tax=Pseudoduganella sp. S-14 TaxID=3404065 RepID=UPI003CFB5D70
MIKLKPIALAAMGCGLLTACSAPPAPHSLALQPVVRGDMPGNQAASWNRLARFHHERGQLALALGAYAQSLALDASQLEARNAVAVIEAQRGDLELARKALVALVKDYPGEAQPHTNLGYVQYLMGDHAGATQTLRRAMALGAGPKAFQNLQLAEAAMGKEPGADAPQLAAAPVAPAAPAEPAALPAGASPAPAKAPAVTAPPEPTRIVTTVASETAPPVPVAAATAEPAAPTPVMRTMPAPLSAAPLAATSPSLVLTPPETPSVSRSEPQQLTALPSQAARDIAAHMELIKVAGNVYELKARVAAEPAAAPVQSAAPIIAAPTPQPEAPAIAQSGKVRIARLEVSNGNGVTGMARRFRSLLGQMGIPVNRLSNDRPFKQMATTIQYSPGFEKQAASLQRALQGKVLLTSKQLASSDVKLVLGKDASVSLAAASEAAGLSLVAMQEDSDN